MELPGQLKMSSFEVLGTLLQPLESGECPASRSHLTLNGSISFIMFCIIPIGKSCCIFVGKFPYVFAASRCLVQIKMLLRNYFKLWLVTGGVNIKS